MGSLLYVAVNRLVNFTFQLLKYLKNRFISLVLVINLTMHNNALVTKVHSNYFLGINFNFKIIITDLALY